MSDICLQSASFEICQRGELRRVVRVDTGYSLHEQGMISRPLRSERIPDRHRLQRIPNGGPRPVGFEVVCKRHIELCIPVYVVNQLHLHFFAWLCEICAAVLIRSCCSNDSPDCVTILDRSMKRLHD